MKLSINLVLSSLLFIIFQNNSFAQNYIGITQNNISILQNNNSNFGLSMIASEISAFRNSWENRKKREEAVSKSQAQLILIKNTYENSNNYPENIIDGWHFVMATDNYNYCSPAKVLIKNNEIVEFVVSNWEKLSIPFKVLSPIQKAKALITLDFNGNTDTLEIFFINDLQNPTVVEKPLNSGFISFWSDLKKADHIKIWFEGNYYGELSNKSESQPNCGDLNTITIEVKPGSYFFKAAGRGSIAWQGNVEIRENSCLSFNLNKENQIP